MKFSILIDILFDLLSKRKITAAYLAEKYEISHRTVYRYVELLATKLPISVKRGRNGGIYLSDSYRLPVGFMSADEYTAAIDALVSAYAQHPDPRFLEAKRKLSTQLKTEKQILVATGEAGGFYVEDVLPAFSEKLRILESCIRGDFLAEIEYRTDNDEPITSHIEPHALLLCKGTWYVYAFCHHKRDFQIFLLGRISTLIQTETTFRKRPFEWSDIPCLSEKKACLNVKLAFAETALDLARNQLGAERLQKSGNKWLTEATFPDSETAVHILLSLGNQVEVLSPISLRDKIRDTAKEIARIYQ